MNRNLYIRLIALFGVLFLSSCGSRKDIVYLQDIENDATINQALSDEKDIAVPFAFRQEVYDWAGENSVALEYQGTLGGMDVWRVRDDQQRVWFALRWQ